MSTDSDRLYQMSLLLKAIEDAHQELTEFRADHKARREKLMGDLSKLRWEVLSGQDRLPLESVLERVVEQVNGGALNTPGTTVTAELRNLPDAECSAEERARTKRQQKNKSPVIPIDADPLADPGIHQ